MLFPRRRAAWFLFCLLLAALTAAMPIRSRIRYYLQSSPACGQGSSFTVRFVETRLRAIPEPRRLVDSQGDRQPSLTLIPTVFTAALCHLRGHVCNPFDVTALSLVWATDLGQILQWQSIRLQL